MIVADWLEATPPEPAQLIYMDPPFMSQRDYGDFDDRWDSREDYLDWMKPRLERCREWLRDDGSFMLHCDPTMSHYLKVLCDTIFPVFVNEIIWCYQVRNKSSRAFPKKHDIILFYRKSDIAKFFPQFGVSRQNIDKRYNKTDVDGKRYREWNDNKKGKSYRYYLDDYRGRPVPSWWDDIPQLRRKLDYATEKPVELLERVIAATTDPGDLVIDPMCGSGTTLVAAKQLGRRYWGCDINPRAVEITNKRLRSEG